VKPRHTWLVGVLVAAALAPPAAGAQGLGGAAEKERKRREALKDAGSGKTYGDTDLDPSGGWHDWRPFLPREKDFSIEFPSKPEVKEETVTDPEHGELPRRAYRAFRDNVVYQMAVFTYPPEYARKKGVEGLLDEIADVAASAVRGELKSSRAVVHRSFPGREVLVLSKSRGGKELHEISRFFLVETRAYVMTHISSPEVASPDTAERFFQSFQVTRAASPPAR
jgi:hypothetical protein